MKGLYLLLILVYTLCGCIQGVISYKPVIALHGFALDESQGTFHDWDDIKSWMDSERPTQKFIALNIFNGLDSTRPLWEQVTQVSQLILDTVSNDTSFGDGYHFLGHSQGGLLLRTMLEVLDNHNVDTFVSLAGIQFGIYGVTFLDNYFPNVTEPYITDLFYTNLLQNEFSAANFWHSPIQEKEYFMENIFLPIVNKEKTNGSNPENYKNNFVRTKKLVFFSISGGWYCGSMGICYLGFLGPKFKFSSNGKTGYLCKGFIWIKNNGPKWKVNFRNCTWDTSCSVAS